jgi:Protein of unknown function (DUF3108)
MLNRIFRGHRGVILGLIIFLLPSLAGAESVEISTPSAEPILLTPVTNTAFQAGEKLEFLIKYQFVEAGVATMEIEDGPMMNHKPTLKLISRARSKGFVDVFFHVDDLNESLVDADSLASLYFHQDLKEGHFKVVRKTTMNYDNRTYYYERHYKSRLNSRTGPINEAASDILSSFFFTRTLPLELGKEYHVVVFSGEGTYPLRVVVGPKLEKIKVPAGKFECIKVEPFIIGEAIFKTKGGKMLIWLTNDERKLPVMVRSTVMIGAIDVELKKIQLPEKK